jgi:Holliday junction resolvase RusA-like endonuclease
MAYPTRRVKTRKGIIVERRVKSVRYKKWLKTAPDLPTMDIKPPIKIHYDIYFPDNRIRDGQNYLKIPLDYMVSKKLLPDDDRRYVVGESWDDCGNDKENPRIVIYILPIGK